jgi:GGDEF domain-containing protein
LPYSKALDSEIEDVKGQHLVIAKNLSVAFERYHQGVVNIFEIINTQSIDSLNSDEFKRLFRSYNFNLLVLINQKGEIQNNLYTKYKKSQNVINSHILNLAKKTLKEEGTYISTVTQDSTLSDEPILLVVKKEKENILLGYINTKYIIKMGKKIAFGDKGHAAIVDQEGNILSHPLDSWIKDRKNISKISIVEKMLKKETGVEKFYSPALKGNMIAGYTFVPNANWGVMVPQPISELKNKAKEINTMALYIVLIGIILAFFFMILITLFLIRPIEKLSSVIKLITEDKTNINLEWNLSRMVPLEIRVLKSSFSKMMTSIDKNKKEISVLAYLDINTGLPNRNYFYELSNKALERMSKLNKKAAFVFVDFDGFKSINDTYGHRIGDELLYLFGKRLKEYFSLDYDNKEMLSFYESLPSLILSRLGGDEFVILLQDIKNKDEVEKKLVELFKELFSKYHLYNNIEINLTGSAGVALYPQDAQNSSELLKLADIAMYDAKKTGKNKIVFFKIKT